jgi:methyl-accepting chemotaxis protein
MSNGFVLVLLRELRETLQKFRQEAAERVDTTSERVDQALASLGRIEGDLNELRKYMRQLALNQAKHEEQHAQSVENVDKELRDLKEQVRKLKQGRL